LLVIIVRTPRGLPDEEKMHASIKMMTATAIFAAALGVVPAIAQTSDPITATTTCAELNSKDADAAATFLNSTAISSNTGSIASDSTTASTDASTADTTADAAASADATTESQSATLDIQAIVDACQADPTLLLTDVIAKNKDGGGTQ
jgi:hypothetical protein